MQPEAGGRDAGDQRGDAERQVAHHVDGRHQAGPVAGLGQGGDRAGLVTAIYVVGYLAFSVPALIAGVATTRYGLHSTALAYSAALAVLAAAAVGILLTRASGPPERAGRFPARENTSDRHYAGHAATTKHIWSTRSGIQDNRTD